MQAELISIGTELLLGEIVDSNSAFLAQKLAECGINLYYQSTVGDNLERGKEILELALKRADLVIISGGLGPTDDDRTREIVSSVTCRELEKDAQVWEGLKKWFSRRYGKEDAIPAHNKRQALFPQGSQVIPNPIGTAPGFLLKHGTKTIIALPGVPDELKIMFENSVLPSLRMVDSGERLVTRNLKFAGIGESKLEEILQDLFAAQANPTLALYASGGLLRIRLTAKASSQAAGLRLIEPIEREIEKRTKGYFFGRDEQTLEQVIGEQLVQRQMTVAVAESCTGGLISHTLTNVPGSSAYFQRAYIVYSNRAKEEDLAVPASVLKEFGAVSAETAAAMAEGVRSKAAVDLGLAVTGIAGPDGGSPDKPVGLTYIGLASLGDTKVEKHIWQGSREQIKDRAALAALRLLWLKSRS